jgi:ribose transport system substrate-binding protein
MVGSKRFGGVAVAAAALALAVAACGSDNKTGGASSSAGSSSSSGGGGGGQPYIAIVSKGFQHQFWQAVKKGAEQEAKAEGARITFEGPPTEQDIEQQVTMLTNAIQKKPAAIGFAALDSKASAPLMDQAKSQNIPVIAFDSGVDSPIPLTTAATDNKAAAAEAAKHLSDLIGGKGKVALVVHDQTSRTGIDRRDGFVEWMKANAPNIKLLPVQYGAGDQAKSADIAKSIIQANPDLKGFYGANEGSAIGIVKGVEESGKKGITIVGFDSGKAQIDAINSGVMAGAITQNPIGMGKALVASAMKAIKGKQLPKVIDTGFFWYDKSNITDPKIQAVLYQ